MKKDSTLVDHFRQVLGVEQDDGSGKNVPAANVPRVFRLGMEFDSLSLIHGFQISFEKLTFVGLRSPRALTASIIGLNAQPVGVPGIKFNPLATGKEAEGVQPIFRKERIVAEKIQANFAIDIGLLTGLSVGASPTKDEKDDAAKERTEVADHRRRLLVALSLWKIARFLKDLSAGHRLRTECDLVLKSVKYKTKWKDDSPQDFPFYQIVADGEKKDGDKPAEGSLLGLIAKAKLPSGRSPLTLEFGG